MIIKLWPDLIDWPLKAYVSGDVITINGDKIDLSGIPDGYRLPGSAVGNKFFVESEYVERTAEGLRLVVRLPVAWDSPEEYRNPAEPIILDVRSGQVSFPYAIRGKEEGVESGEEVEVYGGVDLSKLEKINTPASLELEQLASAEGAWRATQMPIARENVTAIEFGDESIPGTEADWKAYWLALRAWVDGAEGYPDSTRRPVGPA